MTLPDYILAHTERGECTCGRCADAPPNPELRQPADGGHTADLIFFKVCAKDHPEAMVLHVLVKAHKSEYGPCDLFDGKEHSYLEIGGFVGDQGLALQLMGLGSLLGLWKLLTPYTVLGSWVPDETVMEMAGLGYVSIQAEKTPTP